MSRLTVQVPDDFHADLRRIADASSSSVSLVFNELFVETGAAAVRAVADALDAASAVRDDEAFALEQAMAGLFDLAQRSSAELDALRRDLSGAAQPPHTNRGVPTELTPPPPLVSAAKRRRVRRG